jgi:hypothetical protein
MPARTWSPNPYAVAQLLLGRNVDVRDWAAQAQLLEDAFKVRRIVLFDPDGAQNSRFALFQSIADLGDKPTTLDAALQSPLVRQASSIYGEDAVRRVLPFLIPIQDAQFKAPGDGAPGGTFVGDYRPVDQFTIDGATFLDPIQGNVADCYLIASLIALAWVQPTAWKAVLDGSAVAGAGMTKFHFGFFKPDATPSPAFDAPGDVPFDDQGRQCFARAVDPREGWASMLEKAYVMQRAGNVAADPQPADYQMIGQEGVFPQEACQMLIGGAPKRERNLELHALPQWHHFPDRCDAGGVARFPTMAWTWDDASHLQGLTFDQTGLIPNHAYAVLGMATFGGATFMILRNPHGVSATGPVQPAEYATGEWNPGAGSPAPGGVPLNALGVFGLPMAWFNTCFDAMGWVES